MTDREQLAARIAKQSGQRQTQRRVIIGPHGWTLATLPKDPLRHPLPYNPLALAAAAIRAGGA